MEMLDNLLLCFRSLVFSKFASAVELHLVCLFQWKSFD